MANSKITITFNGDPVNNEVISFNRYLLATPATTSQQSETFLTTGRTSNFTVPLAVTTNPPYSIAGTASAINYKYYFNIDHNGYGIYNIVQTFNVVTIELTSDLWAFNNVVLPSTVTALIENISTPTFFLVGTQTYSTATKICSNVNVTIETSELATKIYINDILTNFTNTNNPVTFPVIRGLDNYIRLENAVGDIIEYPTIPKVYYNHLTSENITVGIIQYLTGATLNVSVINKVGLTLQYSLDNVNWQTSNIFTGQEVGTRFLYVRDQFNCVKSKEFTVTALGTRDSFFRISKANSINFSKVEVINGCTIFANDENSLACGSLQKYKHITDTLFQTCDTTTIQFKSNYETVSAVLRNANNSDTTLTVNKKSNNLGRFQRLDALYYKYREGKLAVYFENGDYYDEFGTVLGTYTLGGNLPEFAIIGQFISVGTLGVYKIVDILYDEVKIKKVIIVDYSYTGIDIVETIVESIYDVLTYEVYEFVIDWSSFAIGKYTVHITNSDTINGTINYGSERISLLTEQLNTLAIAYSNNNNQDIFYKYGMVNFIRIPYVKFIAVEQDENEINITDDNTVVVESSVYEKNEIAFDVLTDQLKRKLVVALSCENLFVNGIGYVKDGNVSSENIDNTNLYEVKATLIKTNVSYTNFKDGLLGIDNTSGPSNNIPQIITTGINFIKS